MEEFRLIVFADGAVIGEHPGITLLSQGFSSVVTSHDLDDCVMRCTDRDRKDVNTGDGSYLVTVLLHCLGLRVQPGRSVAFLRVSDFGQASIVYHEASKGSPVPPDALNTAVVGGWQGSGWAEPVQVRKAPDDSPRTDWPINTALRKLGVARGDSPDEIAAVGLVLPTAS